jgi:hypothetical protein
MTKIFGLVAVSAALLGTTACGCQTTCQRAQSYFIVGQGLISEANSAIGQVEALMLAAGATIPEDTRLKLTTAIQKAHEGLQLAAYTLQDSASLCKAVATQDVFAAFNTAWTIIRQLLPVVMSNVGARIGEPAHTVRDPSCYGG